MTKEEKNRYTREWHAANREKANESSRKWHSANPERAKESNRKWYWANLEKARESGIKWREANSEKEKERRRRDRAANPEKWREIRRRVQLKKYGLTEEAYAAMLEAQDGRCAICRCKPVGRRLAVDHCHVTGFNRGLLCTNCNTTVGKHFDSPEQLEAVLKYVKKHSQLRLVSSNRR